jgi:hypothetical protein
MLEFCAIIFEAVNRRIESAHTRGSIKIRFVNPITSHLFALASGPWRGKIS